VPALEQALTTVSGDAGVTVPGCQSVLKPLIRW
jgi:hypothetical protein